MRRFWVTYINANGDIISQECEVKYNFKLTDISWSNYFSEKGIYSIQIISWSEIKDI